MTFDDVISFAKENPYCGFATMDGEQPRTRLFASVFFDDGRIYFTTGAKKDVYKQVRKNPKVELCYWSKDLRTMMRVTGEVEISNDMVKKQRLIDERDYLKNFTADDPELVLLRLSHGKARFWSLKDNLRENELPIIEF